ncbi:putative fungal specific transcription factor [Ceratocystis lukuohia]|uniref:Fungal specific transcription factor n=1 Tax=Ceratocystis lukuohia TaxID=2019550 RepID=A0ABR4MHZ8_9PEZI
MLGEKMRLMCPPDTAQPTFIPPSLAILIPKTNLINLSVLWLGREWVPFLPSASTLPDGPADPPLLPLTAPSNWWADQAAELFGAASHITQMLFSLSTYAHIPQHQPPSQPLSQDPSHPCAAALRTPFAGICAFSAATMNIYVTCFPLMNLNRSLATAARDHERDVAYLDEFRRIWPLGNGWWTTIHQLKELYQRASRDGHTFQGGKTRNDYLRLESSIHDPTGMPPEQHSHSSNIARMDRGDVAMSTGAHGKLCTPESNQNQQPPPTSGIVRPEANAETNADASAGASAEADPEADLTDIVGNSQEAVSTAQTADFASNWSDVWLLLGDQQEMPLGMWG